MNRIKSFSFLVLFPIFLATVGEFILKAEINHLDQKMGAVDILTMALNPMILLGSLSIIGGGFIWVAAMSRYELSFIYPFFSLNFVFVLVGSSFFLGEDVPLVRYLAVVLIIIGLVFISKSKFGDVKE